MKVLPRTLSKDSNPMLNRVCVLFVSLVALGGCVMPPKVDREGTIAGGHPRVRALVEFMDYQWDSSAPHAKTAGYSGVIGPSDLSWSYWGELPRRADETKRATYVVSAAADTIEMAEFAIVTEYLLTGPAEVEGRSYTLQWDSLREEWCVRRSIGVPAHKGSCGKKGLSPCESRLSDRDDDRRGARFVFKKGEWKKEEPGPAPE